jgi:hypothetical protein
VIAGLSILGGITAMAVSGRRRQPVVVEVEVKAATA